MRRWTTTRRQRSTEDTFALNFLLYILQAPGFVCVCCERQRASLCARKPWPLIFFSPSLEEGRQQTQTHDKGMNYIYLRCEGRRRDRHFPTAPFTEPQEKSKGAQQGRPTFSFQRRSSSFPSSSWRSSSSSGLSPEGSSGASSLCSTGSLSAS